MRQGGTGGGVIALVVLPYFSRDGLEGYVSRLFE